MKRINTKAKTIYNTKYIDLLEKFSLERKRLGISQTDVADFLNMKQSDISKIESLERRIDILEFKQLIEAYKINENPKLKKLVLAFFGLE